MRNLKRARHAKAQPGAWRQPVQRLALPRQVATGDSVLAGNAGKAGRFAGAVRPDQRHALPRRNLKAHAIDSPDATKMLDQLLHLQHQPAPFTARCNGRGLPMRRNRSSKPSRPDGAATMISMMNRPSKPRQ